MADYKYSIVERGLNAEFSRQLGLYTQAMKSNPGVLNLAAEITSDGVGESAGWLGAMPQVNEWIGDKKPKEIKDNDWFLINKLWEASTQIKRSVIEDDQLGALSILPAGLVKRIMSHPEKLIVQLINDGTTGEAYDGIPFFANPTGDRINDNLLTGTGVTEFQLQTDLESALITQAGFIDDAGEPRNIRGNVIVCPVALMIKFEKIVKSVVDATSQTAGVFNPFNTRFTVVADARLDVIDATDWYLFATNEVVKPFVFQLRRQAAPRLEESTLNERLVYSADYRGNVGYAIPELAIKTVNA